MSEVSGNSTWKTHEVPRGKHHNKTATKTTVSLYLNRNLVEQARKHRLNISRITEQALSSILDYLQTQNQPEKHTEEWAGPDLNQRPLARKANVLPS